MITSTNEALNTLKVVFSAESLQLEGYSGGGSVAAPLAVRRDDVSTLITVASNLDHQAWTTLHHLSPLSTSLNPADYREQLAHIKQIHFIGSDDKVIPPFLVQRFIASLPSSKQSKVVVVPSQTHTCCWDEIWNDLIM